MRESFSGPRAMLNSLEQHLVFPFQQHQIIQRIRTDVVWLIQEKTQLIKIEFDLGQHPGLWGVHVKISVSVGPKWIDGVLSQVLIDRVHLIDREDRPIRCGDLMVPSVDGPGIAFGPKSGRSSGPRRDQGGESRDGKLVSLVGNVVNEENHYRWKDEE